MQPLPLHGASIYATVFWTAFLIWIVPESVAAITKRSARISMAQDRGSLPLILVLSWIGVGLDFALSTSLPQTAIPFLRKQIFFFGIGMVLAGIALRWYAVAILGRYFTFDVAVKQDQPVIQDGPYRYIRHPSYTGALLTFTGFGLALGNWAGLLAVVSCLGIAYAYRIPIEESALVATIGEPYKQYMRRTRRLIPFLF